MNTSITNFTITKTKYNIMVKVSLRSKNLAQCIIYAAQFEHSVFSHTTLHNKNSYDFKYCGLIIIKFSDIIITEKSQESASLFSLNKDVSNQVEIDAPCYYPHFVY